MFILSRMLYHWYQLYKEPANNVYSMIYYDTKQKYITYTYIYIYKIQLIIITF